MRPRQLKKLDTSGLRIDTSNNTVKLSIREKALESSLVEEPMIDNMVSAPSMSKTAPLVIEGPKDVPNAAPIHKKDLSKDHISNSDTANDELKDPNVHPTYPSFSREVLGEGLASLGDWEEDLLDGDGYEYIVHA